MRMVKKELTRSDDPILPRPLHALRPSGYSARMIPILGSMVSPRQAPRHAHAQAHSASLRHSAHCVVHLRKNADPAFFNVRVVRRTYMCVELERMSQQEEERAWRMIGGTVLIVSLVISAALAFA